MLTRCALGGGIVGVSVARPTGAGGMKVRLQGIDRDRDQPLVGRRRQRGHFLPQLLQEGYGLREKAKVARIGGITSPGDERCTCP